MAKLNFENRWVLVTGASSGLGLALARRLAACEKANLIIAARRKDRLEEIKKEIETGAHTKVEIIPVDLSKDDGVELLFKQATMIGDIYAVINNAGLTSYGKTTAANLDTYENIINVDFKAVMKSCLLFLPYFLERGEGALLNITSAAAFIPTPYQNVYSAAKHAAQAFTECLYREYRNAGKNKIVISTFAPGGIRTEMITMSGLVEKHPFDSPFNMKPEIAAQKALRAFKKGKYLAVPGLLNKLTVMLAKHLPRRLVSRAAEIVYRPPLENKR